MRKRITKYRWSLSENVLKIKSIECQAKQKFHKNLKKSSHLKNAFIIIFLQKSVFKAPIMDFIESSENSMNVMENNGEENGDNYGDNGYNGKIRVF